ncbi:phosphate ABC transporter permease PstA [Sphingomonas prati]|uniref:Phosphate transport system permease protein PstA n=1 Tax=Sphingomonas prati TaxID=1843237 RepID=A0A7W9BU69_9SPHN|nr:phosphate ABC transporter permease PstA [Sphingomonas prati]MBB5730091.1 phosphate transport system permease protein [Sphingomonas prati]GGE91405.1 phosphate transport system permease protein PstA [Sphingomonas prati]
MSTIAPALQPPPKPQPARVPTDWTTTSMQGRIRRRYRSERRFRLLGAGAVLLSFAFLVFLLISMLGQGLRGFTQTELRLPMDFPAARLALDPATLAGPNARAALAAVDLEGATARAADRAYGTGGYKLLSDGAWLSVRSAIQADPQILTRRADIWVPTSTVIDLAAKGDADAEAEAGYRLLDARKAVRTSFSMAFLTGSDSTDPTLVGIWGALKGSLLTMFVTLILAFPIGVLSALYLEEYAARNRWTDLIEVSINNLAAVPSIIFGLLGLAVFLNFLDFPRSAPIVGGLTLALMTMPVIVIAGRNAIKSVPPSIRDAALGIGASKVQVVFHHVLPLALPGILTGTIIGMARALGETAPLLMIGMRAFIASPPGGLADPATVLPVQIFLWSDEVSRGFVEKTSAAIIVLLVFLLAMNGIAIYLRNRFERRW